MSQRGNRARHPRSRNLALTFESLGGGGPGGGHEFGFVQRGLGTEPLSLFRWADVAPERLIASPGDRFAGIGDVETTEFYLPGDNPDTCWNVRDNRGGIALQTFVPAKEVSQKRMSLLIQKRLRYLRDKLLVDLENPTKIFVHKQAHRSLTQAAGCGIRSCGPGQLLCVLASGAEHPPGEIETRAPGVRVAYIDFAAMDDYRSRFPAWPALCGKIRTG